MTESNQLIAEFMGVALHPLLTIEALRTLLPEDRIEFNGYFVDDLKYHESYDWIMEVVERIESLGFKFNSISLYC